MRAITAIALLALAVGVGLTWANPPDNAMASSAVPDSEAATVIGGCYTWTSVTGNCGGNPNCPTSTKWYLSAPRDKKAIWWTCGCAPCGLFQAGPGGKCASSSPTPTPGPIAE